MIYSELYEGSWLCATFILKITFANIVHDFEQDVLHQYVSIRWHASVYRRTHERHLEPWTHAAKLL